jgi:hypothetical protein
MPAEAVLSTAVAVELSAEAAAAVAALPTAARPGGTTATGRIRVTMEVLGTGSETISPVTPTVASAAADTKEEAGVTADLGSAMVSNTAHSTAHSTATAAVAAEWVK